MKDKKRYILALTGATGTVYGIDLLGELAKRPFEIHLIISETAESIIKHENGLNIKEIYEASFLKGKNKDFRLIPCRNDDFYKSPASGSYRHDGMVIAPCSMKSLSEIANGFASNLISRAADVSLKERKPLILLTRETPLNLIHIRNMEKSALAGATIMPPVPSFYNRPETIDDLVKHTTSRVLDQLGIDHDLFPQWGK